LSGIKHLEAKRTKQTSRTQMLLPQGAFIFKGTIKKSSPSMKPEQLQTSISYTQKYSVNLKNITKKS
jgi:hypothetical protein